jgi:hypothetical protein
MEGVCEQKLGGRFEVEVLYPSPVNTTGVHTSDLVGWAQNDKFSLFFARSILVRPNVGCERNLIGEPVAAVGDPPA